MAQIDKNGRTSGPASENAPEPDDSPSLKLIKRGLAGGAFAGFVAAKFYIDSQSVETPVGSVYEGNILLVFALCVGGAAAVGAGVGWLAANLGDGKDVPPPDRLLG